MNEIPEMRPPDHQLFRRPARKLPHALAHKLDRELVIIGATKRYTRKCVQEPREQAPALGQLGCSLDHLRPNRGRAAAEDTEQSRQQIRQHEDGPRAAVGQQTQLLSHPALARPVKHLRVASPKRQRLIQDYRTLPKLRLGRHRPAHVADGRAVVERATRRVRLGPTDEEHIAHWVGLMGLHGGEQLLRPKHAQHEAQKRVRFLPGGRLAGRGSVHRENHDDARLTTTLLHQPKLARDNEPAGCPGPARDFPD